MVDSDVASDWFSALASVPQGSVSAPTLFAIYINDMCESSLRVLLSLFADDASAISRHTRGMRYSTQLKLLREFTDTISEWSELWKLDFSTDKSQLLVVTNKKESDSLLSSHSRTLLISEHPVTETQQYKYLGLTFQANGKWNAQFHDIVTKCTLTANPIARINSRNHPPSPPITISLVNTILIPQMTYSLAFWRPNKSQRWKLNQILASPLRRALGLHSSASAYRTLWECGIPTVETLRSVNMLQAVSRAYRSASNQNYLPSLLVSDIEDGVSGKSAMYCRPLRNEVKMIQHSFPLSAAPPIHKSSSRPSPGK